MNRRDMSNAPIKSDAALKRRANNLVEEAYQFLSKFEYARLFQSKLYNMNDDMGDYIDKILLHMLGDKVVWSLSHLKEYRAEFEYAFQTLNNKFYETVGGANDDDPDVIRARASLKSIAQKFITLDKDIDAFEERHPMLKKTTNVNSVGVIAKRFEIVLDIMTMESPNDQGIAQLLAYEHLANEDMDDTVKGFSIVCANNKGAHGWYMST